MLCMRFGSRSFDLFQYTSMFIFLAYKGAERTVSSQRPLEWMVPKLRNRPFRRRLGFGTIWSEVPWLQNHPCRRTLFSEPSVPQKPVFQNHPFRRPLASEPSVPRALGLGTGRPEGALVSEPSVPKAALGFRNCVFLVCARLLTLGLLVQMSASALFLLTNVGARVQWAPTLVFLIRFTGCSSRVQSALSFPIKAQFVVAHRHPLCQWGFNGCQKMLFSYGLVVASASNGCQQLFF